MRKDRFYDDFSGVKFKCKGVVNSRASEKEVNFYIFSKLILEFVFYEDEGEKREVRNCLFVV